MGCKLTGEAAAASMVSLIQAVSLVTCAAWAVVLNDDFRTVASTLVKPMAAHPLPVDHRPRSVWADAEICSHAPLLDLRIAR